MTVKIHLVVADGEHRGRVIPVLGPRYRIGRDATCQLRPASERVSRWHCEIVVEDDGILVRDLGSTNGTFVNDLELHETEAPLKDGDWLEVGPLLFCVRIKSPSPTGGSERTQAAASDATVAPTNPLAPSLAEEGGRDEPVSDEPTHANTPVPAQFLPPTSGSQAATSPGQPRPVSPGPSGPPTIRRKARPPAAGEGMSKVADDLLKKLSRKPGQPPSRPG